MISESFFLLDNLRVCVSPRSASDVDPCVARIFWSSRNSQGTLVFIAVTAAVTDSESESPLKATVYVALTEAHCVDRNVNGYFLIAEKEWMV